MINRTEVTKTEFLEYLRKTMQAQNMPITDNTKIEAKVQLTYTSEPVDFDKLEVVVDM